MVKKIKYQLVLLSSILLLQGCQEIYEHNMAGLPDYLVVQGLLTNQQGPHGVRLSYTTPYGNETNTDMVSDAQVWITDNEGNEIYLEESTPGWYYTPNDFNGEVGKTYVLHIATPDGYIYQSDPQEMMPPINLQNLDAEFTTEVFYFESNVSSRIYQDIIEGTKVYLETLWEQGDIPKFRFKAELYLQYTVTVTDMPETWDYCWMTWNASRFLPRDIPDYSGGTGYQNHEIGFLPYNTSDLIYLSLPDHSFDNNRTLITTLYSLNDESFAFHQAKNAQLTNEGKFFDPIAVQLQSNIHCVNEPERKVFGLFEASSATAFSHRFVYKPATDSVEIHPWINPELIPEDDCLYMEYPDFWIH